MKTPKFNIGDEVWTMRDNRPCKAVICGVQITARPDIPYPGVVGYKWLEPVIRYVMWNEGAWSADDKVVSESMLFNSMEELRDSLFKETTNGECL